MDNTLFSIAAENVPQFDELYVISDLHLGGQTDFQIFNSGKELKALISHLATVSPARRVALLINGDFVDFLAEYPEKHFDPQHATKKLKRIAIEDPAFNIVFDALTAFAKKKNRTLIINLGNHDLELALPWVRACLLDILSGGDEAACGRITFAFDGTGFPCKVGNAMVLCVHGNEVDTWNVADYEKIRRFGLEVTHGGTVKDWIPNAGSQLVIDVMNGLKKTFPFIDLLKPETQAAVPTLLALAPDQHDKLRAIAATARRLAWDSIRRMTGFLGSVEEDLEGRTIAAAGILSSRPGISSADLAYEFDREQYAKTLLDDAEDMLNRGVTPMSLIGADDLEKSLGLTSAVIKLFRGEDRAEVLREALKDLHKDRSFDPTAEDATFELLDELVGDGFDFLIAGHTHLARALERKKHSGWYFNSGTWARLIKLEERVLSDAAEFKKVFETFKKGSMAALDSFPKLVMRRLTVVVIRAEGKKTHGELRQVNLSASGEILPKATDYRFTKS